MTDRHLKNCMEGLRIAVLTAGPTNGLLGGAERFYKGLVEAFREIGCHSELVSLPADEPSFEQILDNYSRCSTLDLSDFDVVVSTKAPTYAVNHPRHVLYLVHTVRVFDDMFYEAFPNAGVVLYEQRAELQTLDFKALTRIKSRFAIGHEVANRLYRWKGLTTEVLHPPLGMSGFRCGPTGDYFLLPGRLHPWKRIDLVIDAVRCSKLPLRLIIAGTGEAEAELKTRAGNDPRIEFVGRVSDEELISLYENALAVPFVPVREDYGYVTLEAFSSGKPVVTCRDSGEPTYFVRHGETGLVCEPDAESLCVALEWLFSHRTEAEQMGRGGKESIAEMSWTVVANRLLESVLTPSMQIQQKKTNVAVLDMQPIDPPVGGGRLRLLGLYHNLGDGVSCQYIGSYDWPGEQYRRHQLSPCLEEIDVPLSTDHHAAAHALSAQVDGKTVIDISFGRLGHLSEDYLTVARDAIRAADVVVFSHPWVYPLVRDMLSPSQVVIYDSQNVEGYLRAQLLNEGKPQEAGLLQGVVQDEYDVGRRADLILACSQEDLLRFNRIYEFPTDKVRVIPNGVMAFSNPQPTPAEKHLIRTRLGLAKDQLVAIFIGSAYGPNLEAARFIIDSLANALPDVYFVIAGGVGAKLSTRKCNVKVTGGLDEDEKYQWLCVSDIAVNPMFSGSGTNIKMFDFMACRLPSVTTAVGARGIDQAGRKAMLVVEENTKAFVEAINQLRNETLRVKVGANARICVEDGYSWERISVLTGAMITSRQRLAGQPKPAFSIVIPSYERHDQLEALMHCLQKQIERDFEVIVIDQSADRWRLADDQFGFPLLYFHTLVKGAVRARNTGATLAQGKIIAFTDDDCLPETKWLLHARAYFGDENIVGVEGIVVSDHMGEASWRPVTNVGFEGIGFMTANMMVRAGHFHRLGGFDLEFDRPHFREDTDFGWRLQALGKVPYAQEVRVFHPAQPRANERESIDARACFFEKDALLFKKHPDRYRELFMRERHYEITPGFSDNLRRGFALHDVELPAWIEGYLSR